MRITCIAALIAAGLLSAGSAVGEPLDYSFDTVHTQVHATANHMGWSNSTARLSVQDGTIRYDPDDLAASSVNVAIGLDSLDLGDATWKEHVSAEKWLDVASFPTARFVSTEVKPTGDQTFDLVGELTLKGVTRPVTLHATINKAGPHPFTSKPSLGVSATGTLKRSEFGVSEFLPGVGDEVKLRIELEASADKQ